MRGASALGELLAKYPHARVHVMVVWMPIIPTDTGPPDSRVTGPLADSRVSWYWDEQRILTPPMVERTRQLYERGLTVPQVEPGDLLWDVITAYDPGVVWEEPFPVMSWFGMEMVLHSLPMVERRLKEMSPS